MEKWINYKEFFYEKEDAVLSAQLCVLWSYLLMYKSLPRLCIERIVRACSKSYFQILGRAFTAEAQRRRGPQRVY
jgi:hypothetical protein